MFYLLKYNILLYFVWADNRTSLWNKYLYSDIFQPFFHSYGGLKLKMKSRKEWRRKEVYRLSISSYNMVVGGREKL